MPYSGASELGGSVAAVSVTFNSGRQGKIPVVAVVDTSGKPTSALPDGVDRSGTIAAGGTAQSLAVANASRRYLRGQNLSGGDLWVREVAGAAAAGSPSYRVPAGGTFSINTAQDVSIWGATTGQAWSATEG